MILSNTSPVLESNFWQQDRRIQKAANDLLLLRVEFLAIDFRLHDLAKSEHGRWTIGMRPIASPKKDFVGHAAK